MRPHQDPDAIEWGDRVFDYAMDQIEPDGSLPNEMKRAGRALHYHLYAAEPLAMLSSILDRDSPKLDKLVALCIAGIRDPTQFEQRTGVTQEGIVQSDFVWLLVYARRTPSFDMTGPSHQHREQFRSPAWRRSHYLQSTGAYGLPGPGALICRAGSSRQGRGAI